MKTLAQGLNTTAHDSNPDSRSREAKALPLSHCALQVDPIDIVICPLDDSCVDDVVDPSLD